MSAYQIAEIRAERDLYVANGFMPDPDIALLLDALDAAEARADRAEAAAPKWHEIQLGSNTIRWFG